MNYQKIYNQLIERSKLEESESIRKKKNGNYYESHHIIPKCLGGDNSKDNLVLLTAREHFICHWILVRMYPENKKLASAFWNMCNVRVSKNQDRYIPTSRTYSEAREAHSRSMSILLKNIPAKEEWKLKRKSTKGRPGTWIGRKHSPESIEKMRQSALNRAKPSQETIDKRVSKLVGKKRSEETKKKMSDNSFWKGKSPSEETKNKIRETLKATREKAKLGLLLT